jgi:hypothetical protein
MRPSSSVIFDLDVELESRDPIGKDVHDQIGVNRIIADEVDCKIMWTIHAFVHHEGCGFYRGAFSWIEDHRTDGQIRRSTPLQYLDEGLFLEAQDPVTSVGDLDGEDFWIVEFYIPIIDLLLIHSQNWGTATGILLLH